MPDLRADLHAVFAQSCLDGAHVRHVRELDVFINHSTLADRDLSLQLTHALRSCWRGKNARSASPSRTGPSAASPFSGTC